MKRVMFVCKKNSARSQMAEGFAKTFNDGSLEIVSSGLEASQVNPGAIAAMDAVGIDIRNQTSDPLSDFKAEDFDVVISLCGCGVNLPPDWVVRDVFEDWQLDDPASASMLYQQISSTQKQLLWLQASDHIIPLDRERNEVFRAVGEFLAS